ncbi:type II secretion system ATPase GspE [Pseudoxanthomonas koreensis]|uniref:type II secretion system ATPase GspE n=1 Tax=Pseudoxanthomonas koreensis TaxID=266061 RepID=UPI0035A64139
MTAAVASKSPGTEQAEARVVAELVASGKVKPADVERAEGLRDGSGLGVLGLLSRLGLLSERDHAEACAQALQLPLLAAIEFPDALPLERAPQLADLPLRFLQQFHACPLDVREGVLDVLLADPHDPYPLQAIGLACGLQTRAAVALRSDIDTLIERWFGQGRSSMDSLVEAAADPGGAHEDDVEHLRDLASEAPVIRLVNALIHEAVELHASDIHLEPFEKWLKVRYRVDGVLVEGESPPAQLSAAVVSRIKIMARMNIAERRLPQDGRIMVRVQGQELDLRVSTVPTAHGESVALRLLDRRAATLGFRELGFSEDLLPALEKILAQPHGIVLVTGPTGSGKTTTLYAALARLNTDEVKIITVEDPVEYQIEGINQIHARPQIGLDFANALRSIVRQDPDIIMIGEMRDVETARIAIQSALTGHLVLSTLHTNNAAGGIARLLDMGVEDYLLTSTVNAIMAQRLVRRIEPTHARRRRATAEEIEAFDLRRLQPTGDIVLTQPCPSALTPTGYLGRTTIAELLVMDDGLRGAIMRRAGAGEINALAQASGMRTMFDDGLRKALQGVTTIEEVMRVTEG